MKSSQSKSQIGLRLAIFLFSLLGTAHAQEIPNGDGDLLWERGLNGRTVNDAKFHPINGNIIAAVNHEIWEIDPKDGHTIRIFEGPTKIDEGMFLTELNISPDGNLIVTNGLQYYSGIYFWDYNQGKIIDSLNYLRASEFVLLLSIINPFICRHLTYKSKIRINFFNYLDIINNCAI